MKKKDYLIIITYASLILGVIWFAYAFMQERKIRDFSENGQLFKSIITNGRVTSGTKKAGVFT